MQFANRITDLTLDGLLARSEGEKAALVGLIADSLRTMESTGLHELSAEAVREIEETLAAAAARYFLAHDTADGYYRRVFKGLDLDVARERLAPEIFLSKLSYPVRDLVGGRAQELRLAKGLSGGRVFHSSGTSNPRARKKVYFDEGTVVLLREMTRLGWEAASGLRIGDGDQLLLLIPDGAKAAMPFGALVSDTFAASGVRVHWGAEFRHEPEIFTDPTFSVATANLDFRGNVRPCKGRVAAFNTLTRLRRGNHLVLGLLPNMYSMLRAVSGKRGIAGFFARPRPVVFAGGGGLKGMGVLPEVREQGDHAVRSYLAEVAEVTGTDRQRLEQLHRSDHPEDQAAFDEICTLFFARRVEELSGVRYLNVYSATEIQPSMFSVGSLRELYGSGASGADRPPRDVYLPLPGLVVELRDPVTDEVIPRTELDRPGIARVWYPFDLSHLHAIESEDLLAWTPIPKTAPYQPRYCQGVGLSFRGRAPGGNSGGFCA